MDNLLSLLFPNTPVLIAVSGGVDSMVLLHRAMEALPSNHITIVHFDHGIRGTDSKDDRIFVENFAKQHALSCLSTEENITLLAQKEKRSLEEIGRERRYAFFAQVAKETGVNTLLTAHHLDDRIETAMLHLIRGTKLRGIHALKPKDRRMISSDLPELNIYRPLIHIPKSDIITYAKAYNIPYREDSTNSDIYYRRNFLRHQILPQYSAINPGYRKAFDQFIQYTESISQWQSEVIRGWLQQRHESLSKLHDRFSEAVWIFSKQDFQSETHFFREEIIAFLYHEAHHGNIGLSETLMSELMRFIHGNAPYGKKNIRNLCLERRGEWIIVQYL